jgi:predicted ABC-type ATPase
MEAVGAVVAEILDSDEKFNVVLQSHTHEALVQFAEAGYRTTLVSVALPLADAVSRARSRAVETGRFLAPTLAAQDRVTEAMWNHYVETAPWYGLWADEMVVVNNGGANPKTAVKDAERFVVTRKNISKVRQAVRRASGL